MEKSYLVGIGGTSCSGKSTFTEGLKEKLRPLKVKSFHMDDYYKSEELRPSMTGPVNGKRYRDDNHPDALELDRFYEDLESAAGEGWDVILVDGVFSLWDPRLASGWDLKIYVDCDPQERLVRRIKRHSSFGDDFDEIADRYIHAVIPRETEYAEIPHWKADIIINGVLMPEKGLEMVCAWIMGQAQRGK